MRYKIIIPMLLLALLAVWYYSQLNSQELTDTKSAEKVKTETFNQSSAQSQEIVQNPEAATKTSEKTDSEQEEIDSELVTAISLLEEQKYSIDPVVELTSIMTEYSGCNGMVQTFKMKDVIITDKRSAIINQHQKQCEALEKKYPFITDRTQTKKINKHLRKQPSLTALGDMYREDNKAAFMADISGELNKMTRLGIKEKNSQILVQNVELMNMPFFKPDKTIREILGGMDENYFRLIQNHTMSLLSCRYQGGISCLPESKIMKDKCMQNEDYCGLNYSEWYQQYTTKGQKRDVEKLIAYYQGELLSSSTRRAGW